MKLFVKCLITFIIVALTLTTSVLLVLQFRASNTVEDSFRGLSLVPPPAYATEATSSTPALNTSSIGLITYCQRSFGWTLADAVPAFVSYLDGGNYYDGLVRVWDVGIGASGTGAHADIKVRIRADGWLVAWLDRYEDDSGSIVWWGHTVGDGGYPPQYSTVLSRAIYIVYYVTGFASDFPGYDGIGMYDYSEPNASKLLFFGCSQGGGGYGTSDYYYTIPPNSTLSITKLLIRTGCTSWATLMVDGSTIYNYNDLTAPNRWETIQLYDAKFFTKGFQHTIDQYHASGAHSVAFIMWAE